MFRILSPFGVLRKDLALSRSEGLSVTGLLLLACLMIVVVNPYINPLRWGYERGKEMSREFYGTARYENSQGHLFKGLYDSYWGLRISIDSEFDYLRARPFLDKIEKLSREGKLLEARAVCLEAEQILIQHIWDSGIYSNCTF